MELEVVWRKTGALRTDQAFKRLIKKGERGVQIERTWDGKEQERWYLVANWNPLKRVELDFYAMAVKWNLTQAWPPKCWKTWAKGDKTTWKD